MVEPRIPAERLAELVKIDPLRSLAPFATTWAIIIATAIAQTRWGTWWTFPLALLMIARSQHALAILMHEGAHARVLPSRRWNDLVAGYLAGYPVMISISAYRRAHTHHHKDPLAPTDPDLVLTSGYPVSRAKMARRLLRDLAGISFFKVLTYVLTGLTLKERRRLREQRAEADQAIRDPAMPDPAMPDPAMSDTAMSDPAMSDPAMSDPAMSDPATPDPAMSDTAMSDPAMSDRATRDPAMSDRATRDPAMRAPNPNALRFPGPEVARALAVQAVLLAICWATGHPEQYFLLWYLPLITVLQVLLRLRGLADHANLPEPTEANPLPQYVRTRTVISNPITKFFLAPLDVGYHLEHHLYVGLPWYRLREAHAILRPAFEAHGAPIERGYFEVLRKMVI